MGAKTGYDHSTTTKINQTAFSDKLKFMIEKLTWREKFAASLLLLIGIGYAAVQVMNILSSRADGYKADESAFTISRGELLSDLKTYSTIFFALVGSILLFRQKRWGWIIGLPMLLLYLFLSGFGVYSNVNGWKLDASMIFLLIVFSALFLSFVFLVIPSARRKYKVGKYTYLPTLVFLMAICAMYFFLQ